VLLNELKKFNKELLDKKRLLAITKSDLLDEELMAEMKKELPKVPHIFISSATNVQGFVQVWELAFRLLVNVSQIYRFKLMFYSFVQ
jgi:GTP-binding protein